MASSISLSYSPPQCKRTRRECAQSYAKMQIRIEERCYVRLSLYISSRTVGIFEVINCPDRCLMMLMFMMVARGVDVVAEGVDGGIESSLQYSRIRQNRPRLRRMLGWGGRGGRKKSRFWRLFWTPFCSFAVWGFAYHSIHGQNKYLRHWF